MRRVIDAHHHLWDLAAREHRWLMGGQSWASDDELAVLRRSFTLADLAPLNLRGRYMAAVFEGRPVWPQRALGWCERGMYRLCGIDAGSEMGWKQYALALLLFNALGALALYALQRGQA